MHSRGEELRHTKKVASTTRLIFPCSAIHGSGYDECAHGWLDGLNRLFMEATLVIYASVFGSKLFS